MRGGHAIAEYFGLERSNLPLPWLLIRNGVTKERRLITCCIQYTLDPHQIDDFENYAKRWPPIIERCGGRLVGYFLPKEGANNFALALIDFESLADYEQYRKQLAADPDARQNLAAARQSRCILVESRSFLRRV